MTSPTLEDLRPHGEADRPYPNMVSSHRHFYPDQLGKINIFVDNKAVAQNVVIEYEPAYIERDSKRTYADAVVEWLNKTQGGDWALTDESQHGYRGWLSFQSAAGRKAIIYWRSEEWCEFTNAPLELSEWQKLNARNRLYEEYGEAEAERRIQRYHPCLIAKPLPPLPDVLDENEPF